HRAIDFVVDLALFGEKRLGAVLQLAQDERRNLRRREFAVAETDPNHTAGLSTYSKREVLRFMLHVLAALAHEALDRIGSPLRVGQQPALRLPSDDDRAVVVEGHNGRHEAVAAPVTDHERDAVFHVGDKRVRGPEIDPDDFAHITATIATMDTKDTKIQEAWSPSCPLW